MMNKETAICLLQIEKLADDMLLEACMECDEIMELNPGGYCEDCSPGPFRIARGD